MCSRCPFHRAGFSPVQLQHLRPIEHSLDPAAEPGCGLGFRQPNRLQGVDHVRRLDVLDRHVAKDRIGVRRQRLAPLVAVFCVPPAGLLRVDQILGHVAERLPIRQRLSRSLDGFPLGPPLCLGLALLVEHVDLVGLYLCAVLPGSIPRIGKIDVPCAADPHFVRLAVKHKSVYVGRGERLAGIVAFRDSEP
jgi:hypothetical protein